MELSVLTVQANHLFNLLTGVYEPSSGTIKLELNGEEVNIGGLKPYNVTKAGLPEPFRISDF